MNDELALLRALLHIFCLFALELYIGIPHVNTLIFKR